MKVVIVEDEKITSQDLINTLQKIDHDISVVATLTSIGQAIEYFETHCDFNLIFSDIQLPDGLSFEIFKTVKIHTPIIFCTAFDSYTLDAFDTNGIVYLLKPFNKKSVSKALDKYQMLKDNFTDNTNAFNQITQNFEQKTHKSTSSILIYQGEKIIPVKISDFALFTIEKRQVFGLTFSTNKLLISHNLEELEEICTPVFFRANRQFLVNRKAIKDVERYFNRKIMINLTIDFKESILVGKLKNTAFLEWLSS
ncbi:MAG: DNA-binding response regulator [Crocinitomicaceae bacterium]|nr:DNA-binding response regulator [Crocinitomicaceae bacterium]